jgi:hypothetical protein
MRQTSVREDQYLTNGTIAAAINATQQLEISKTAIPTVKCHQLRLKSTLFGLFNHVLKVIILAQTPSSDRLACDKR